jgi:protein ImuA
MLHTDPTSLPFAPIIDTAALSARRNLHWRPGLAAQAGPALHSEVFASSREAGGAAASLALALDDWRNVSHGEGREAQDRRSVLWVQTREAARLTGRPCRAGLPEELRTRVIHVLAEKAADALFALEEGLRCRDLAFVIGEIAGNPRALDFTASRRLSLASEKHGVPLFLVRLDAARDLSSARMRWEVASAPSALPRWNAQAPGAPQWRAELFRARSHAPGEWSLHEEVDGKLWASRIGAADNDTAGMNWTAGLRRRRLQQGR